MAVQVKTGSGGCVETGSGGCVETCGCPTCIDHTDPEVFEMDPSDETIQFDRFLPAGCYEFRWVEGGYSIHGDGTDIIGQCVVRKVKKEYEDDPLTGDASDQTITDKTTDLGIVKADPGNSPDNCTDFQANADPSNQPVQFQINEERRITTNIGGDASNNTLECGTALKFEFECVEQLPA